MRTLLALVDAELNDKRYWKDQNRNIYYDIERYFECGEIQKINAVWGVNCDVPVCSNGCTCKYRSLLIIRTESGRESFTGCDTYIQSAHHLSSCYTKDTVNHNAIISCRSNSIVH
jgi:hypothetical protein